MAILFAEDFKGYGDQKDLLLNGLWGTAGVVLVDDPDPVAPPDPVTGSKKVARFANYQNGIRRPFAKGGLAIAGIAYRLWLDTLPNFGAANVRFLDLANRVQASLCIFPTGVISVWKGVPGNGGGVQLGATAVPVLTANAWHHIEFKVVTDPGGVGTGAFEVRIDGNTVLAGNAVNTGSAYQVAFGTTNDYDGTASVECEVKDVVQWDGSGNYNNDFAGTVSVISLWPDADETLGGWNPSTGQTGWNLLDNSPPQDNVDYLTAHYPPPPAMQFDLSDLPLNVSSVRALIPQVRARKADGGDGNIQSSLISNGETANGSDRPITTAFTYYEDPVEVDPNTGVRWTPAGADSVQLKLNRTI